MRVIHRRLFRLTRIRNRIYKVLVDIGVTRLCQAFSTSESSSMHLSSIFDLADFNFPFSLGVKRDITAFIVIKAIRSPWLRPNLRAAMPRTLPDLTLPTSETNMSHTNLSANLNVPKRSTFSLVCISQTTCSGKGRSS